MAKKRKSTKQQPNAPTKGVWLAGIILGIAGLIGHFASVDVLSPNKFWLVAGGFILLAIGTTFKDL